MTYTKYVIEVENEPMSHGKCDENPVYRAKGFKSLVFDAEGLKKLKIFRNDEEYKRGQREVIQMIHDKNYVVLSDSQWKKLEADAEKRGYEKALKEIDDKKQKEANKKAQYEKELRDIFSVFDDIVFNFGEK